MTDDIDLDRRWETMFFGICRSCRYHQYRRAFFNRLSRTSSIASVVFGSTAFVGVLQGERAQILALWASAGLVCLATVNVVFNSAVRARDHRDFMRRYVELEKRMLQPVSEELLMSITVDRLSIEADEPPTLHVLNSICHNEQLRAVSGYTVEEYSTISPLQRLFSQFFDYRENIIKKSAE